MKSSSRKSRHSHKDRSSRHKSHKSHDLKLPRGAQKITEDDYFLRQREFRVWLAQKKNKYVEDLSTYEAMDLFVNEFARKWNRGKLSKLFYEGLPDGVVEQTKRTRHQWNFVSNLGDKERFELATAKDSVDVATKQKQLLLVKDEKKEFKQEEERHGKSRRDQAHEINDWEKKRNWHKMNRKKDREHRDVELDEFAVKATGREAQIEKRRQIADKLHGAARDREAARDGLDVNEDFLMGGQTSSNEELKRLLDRRNLVRRRKLEQQQTKISDLQAKESARMEKFLNDMGLANVNAKDGKPMTIAPRR
ncbi:uncharacterized protein PHALS_05648 [Plasmopara halstedii]|uniref:Uncharacterized protein n=1 Tax=Plasmopara halstedii TaxID=4781 RepID=A0A0P1B2P6_PLAHL|nr:uncharacterized protein PHALS_05648 [Plasmopara halstedii]CEG48178.1 hypothetical protein PHALS_05648 [Plasmopara halstedii]|eukprot:XP_024584547.1 hypothetical protein PHALS_05648 [Plasmopara halstedii]